MFRELLMPIDKFMSFCLKNRFVELFPTGGGWSIIALASFYLLTFAVLLVLYFALRLVHSGTYVREVTVEFSRRHIATGAVVTLIALINPKGAWSIVSAVAVLCWVLALVVQMHSKLSALENPQRGRLFYWGLGIEYAVCMFFIGVIGLMTLVGSILLTIALIVGVAFVTGGFKSMLEHTPSSGSGCGGSSYTRVTLDDGTVIENRGSDWHDISSFDTYHKNSDGTYSKN